MNFEEKFYHFSPLGSKPVLCCKFGMLSLEAADLEQLRQELRQLNGGGYSESNRRMAFRRISPKQ